MPLGAVIGPTDVMNTSITTTTTSEGHPVSCAASLKMIEVIYREKLVENASKVGEYIMKRLREMQEKYDVIGDVRGKGLAIGVELVKDRKKTPADARSLVIRTAYRKGLLILRGGTYGHVLRITPPLNMTYEEADKGLEILEEVFSEAQI